MKKQSALVICETVYPEVSERIPSHISRVEVLPFRYHLYPAKLNDALKETLHKLDEAGEWERILLGYGLCSNGVDGLLSRKSRLVIPRVDDCIALFLGSTDRFRQEQKQEPGTYYLTKGWIDCKADSLCVLRRQHEWTAHLDAETAEWFARDMVKNYTRLALVDTGSYDIAPFIEYSREVAQVFDHRFEIMPGTVAYLEALLSGPWDDRFIVVKPGQPVKKEMFR